MTIEHQRLQEADSGTAGWRKWGPYLSERQWGTVREDYSESGDAWAYFPHDHARSRAYRWGEDGLAGVSDDRQQLCLALALWNGVDPILKERLFGLTNSEGNHGEDVKEYYFYLDSTPTHSYMKFLYKYPQAAFPYDELIKKNAERGRLEPEFELLDTGVFNDDRYFDVFVEYAKESADDLLIRITVHNRGSEPADIHLLPTLWFRNEWSWIHSAPRPSLNLADGGVLAQHAVLGEYHFGCEGDHKFLFTENETNVERLFGAANRTPYVKDAFHEYVVHGKTDAVNPAGTGTKAAAHVVRTVHPGRPEVLRVRLSRSGGSFNEFDRTVESRRVEADEYYAALTPTALTADEALVFRQALAGMMWSKQFYYYDVDLWLSERGSDPFDPKRRPSPRNEQWHHMYNGDVISMPDKWEYPWYAAWDLAFHVLPLTLVDPWFGKEQLRLMLRERYMHPNGQIPAYEWNFGDVNPPVHAWATMFAYRMEKIAAGEGDREWLKSCFQKLLLNFTWWVNRKDRSGKNVFEGGFLGLDNIGVFDRSAPLPTGGHLEQADGTAWMALFCQNMIEMAVELALTDGGYVDMVLKFVEHFMWIASSMTHISDGTGMWDEEDGFFYDVLRLPDGRAGRLKVRSMVGLLPLCAATVYENKLNELYPEVPRRFARFLESRPEMRKAIHDPAQPGVKGRRLASILNEDKLRRVLEKMLDENEFLSPFGIRSLSRYHADHPYLMQVHGQEYGVGYLPAESDSGMFGGNSNWRGPVWAPVNAMIIRALLHYHAYYGDSFTIECPTGSGNRMTLYQVAGEIARRIHSIFLRDQNGRRPVFGGAEKFQTDPSWQDCLLFYEYFHGDNGAGIGASHQTGWTGIVARSMHLFAQMTTDDV